MSEYYIYVDFEGQGVCLFSELKLAMDYEEGDEWEVEDETTWRRGISEYIYKTEVDEY